MTEPAVRFEVRGVDELRVKLGRVLNPVSEMIKEAAEFGRDRMRLYAKPHPADKGTLAEAAMYTLAPGPKPLSATVSLLGRGHGIRSSLAAIGWTVNYGRDPGKPPPVLSILRWLRSHGYHANPRLVAIQIIVSGTKGVLFLERAEEDLIREVPAIIRRAVARVKEEWRR